MCDRQKNQFLLFLLIKENTRFCVINLFLNPTMSHLCPQRLAQYMLSYGRSSVNNCCKTDISKYLLITFHISSTLGCQDTSMCQYIPSLKDFSFYQAENIQKEFCYHVWKGNVNEYLTRLILPQRGKNEPSLRTY